MAESLSHIHRSAAVKHLFENHVEHAAFATRGVWYQYGWLKAPNQLSAPATSKEVVHHIATSNTCFSVCSDHPRAQKYAGRRVMTSADANQMELHRFNR